jgi:multidrug efflux pump subunit AcrB
LHIRAPAGTRIEETERLFSQVEEVIRRTIPAEELSLVLDNIGLPVGGVNLAFSDSSTIGPSDGEILVALNPEHHGSTWQYVRALRQRLNVQFPQLTFFFQPADIVGQILNFGLPAPIDIQVVGRDLQANYAIAKHIEARVARIPGAVDVHVHQIVDAPQLFVNVDRTRAAQMGLTQRDVANNLLVSLSSSGQTAPNYWLNPQNGVNYLVAVQTPQYRIDSIDALQSTPIVVGSMSAPQLLSNLATVERRTEMAVVNHYNVQPVVDVYANVQDRDLGAVARDIDRVVAEFQS